jgi:hypothetical protein
VPSTTPKTRIAAVQGTPATRTGCRCIAGALLNELEGDPHIRKGEGRYVYIPSNRRLISRDLAACHCERAPGAEFGIRSVSTAAGPLAICSAGDHNVTSPVTFESGAVWQRALDCLPWTFVSAVILAISVHCEFGDRLRVIKGILERVLLHGSSDHGPITHRAARMAQCYFALMTLMLTMLAVSDLR